MSPDPEPYEPHDRLVHVNVTFVLPHRLGWLLAGIALGNLELPDGLLEQAGSILRALPTG
jgi:hypothetical protein